MEDLSKQTNDPSEDPAGERLRKLISRIQSQREEFGMDDGDNPAQDEQVEPDLPDGSTLKIDDEAPLPDGSTLLIDSEAATEQPEGSTIAGLELPKSPYIGYPADSSPLADKPLETREPPPSKEDTQPVRRGSDAPASSSTSNPANTPLPQQVYQTDSDATRVSPAAYTAARSTSYPRQTSSSTGSTRVYRPGSPTPTPPAARPPAEPAITR